MTGSSKRQRTTRRPADAPKCRYLAPLSRSVRDGLRWVEPYPYEFNAYVKGRWVGCTLLDVCQREFVAQTNAYYKEAIEDGRIRVNREIVQTDYVLDHNDLITHKTVCAENPVSSNVIQTVFESEDLLVVSKPPSIPIHACGGYRVNTLVSILEHERQPSSSTTNGEAEPVVPAEFLFPAHRIDRLTSGLVILGKSSSAVRDITEAIAHDPSVKKEYLALVSGEFKGEARSVKGWIKCVDFRIGKFVFAQEIPEGENNADWKDSETVFTLLHYYPERNESLVLCSPITGRTHQIRLHLQGIGNPIGNDICYGGVFNSEHPFAIKQIPSVQYDTGGTLFCGGIFLHAWKYTIPGLPQFVTPLPPWAPHADTTAGDKQDETKPVSRD